MKHVIEQEQLRPPIVEAVEELSGQDVKECYQCGKCSAGCPIAADTVFALVAVVCPRRPRQDHLRQLL